MMLCDLCGGSGIESKDYWSQDENECRQCGGHGFDPELVREGLVALYVEFGATTQPVRKEVVTAVLSVVRERLER